MFFKTGALATLEKVSIDNWRKLVVGSSARQNPDDIKTQAEFDIDEGNFLYMRSRAVSAGEYHGPNGNGDYFPEE